MGIHAEGMIPPLPHTMREAAERLERLLMLQRLGVYLNPDRRKEWIDSGYQANFRAYVEEHPDEIIYLNESALEELQQRIDARREFHRAA